MNFETFYKKRSSRRCLGGRGGGTRLEPAPWGSRPTPGGSLAFSRESRRKSAGGSPWPPASWPARYARSFWRLCPHCSDRFVYFGAHLRALIWGLFRKILFSIFSLENASQIGFNILEVIASRTHQRKLPQKTSEWERAVIKLQGQGRNPGPPISRGANYNRKCNSGRKRPTGRQQSGRIRESIKTSPKEAVL